MGFLFPSRTCAGVPAWNEEGGDDMAPAMMAPVTFVAIILIAVFFTFMGEWTVQFSKPCKGRDLDKGVNRGDNEGAGMCKNSEIGLGALLPALSTASHLISVLPSTRKHCVFYIPTSMQISDLWISSFPFVFSLWFSEQILIRTIREQSG